MPALGRLLPAFAPFAFFGLKFLSAPFTCFGDKRTTLLLFGQVRRKEGLQPLPRAPPVRRKKEHGHAQPRRQSRRVQAAAPPLQQVLHGDDEHGAAAAGDHFLHKGKRLRQRERFRHAHRKIVRPG